MGNDLIQTWDFLVITASDEAQAAAYEQHLQKRRALGYLRGIAETLIVPDPGGARIGSGGSTLLALARVLETLGCEPGEPEAVARVLQDRRILIIHGGGDSRRLPWYGPAGKVFLPVPSETLSAVAPALFDRLLPALARLPAPSGTGHAVIGSGDVLLEFDPDTVSFASTGVTGLACKAPPETAAHHGVYQAAPNGRVLRYLQKPSPETQHCAGVVGNDGHALLDIGVLSIAPDACAALLALCRPDGGAATATRWTGPLASAVEQWGLDIYTEVCCAMGEDVSFDEYGEAVEAAGSRLPEDRLEFLFDALRAVPFQVCALPECRFLHFGSLPRLVASGLELTRRDDSPEAASQTILNTVVYADGRLEGGEAWVEGCAIESVLHLAGGNVVTGLDLTRPLPLPRGACLDIVPGRDGEGNPFHCLRVCHIHDNPKATLIQGGAWCGVPLAGLPTRAGVPENGIWPEELPARERSLWFARVHPIVANPGEYADWRWLLESAGAGPSQWAKWREAKRCSMADMARLIDHDAFIARRERLHCRAALPAFINALGSVDGPSARELATAVLASDDDGQALATRFCSLVTEHTRAAEHEPLGSAVGHENGDRDVQEPWDRPRFAAQTVGSVPVFESFDADSNQMHRPLGLASALHTLGSVLAFIDEIKPEWVQSWVARVAGTGNASMRTWLRAREFAEPAETGAAWAQRLQSEAFEQLRRAVVYSAPARRSCPRSSLITGETVWGRAPVRLDLAGGWSDTPPYTLEHGGCVLNAAVDLDGQPPIQAYGRIIPEPVIRLVSTDQETRVEIRTLAELLDYRNPASEFALPKAVLALSGLVPDAALSPVGARLDDLLAQFGGGIELTTSAAVPRGSGLGTSSIMGAVLLAIVHRLMGRDIERRELFHEVLRLEQSLTTGGGWQDQIGGVMPGVKLIRTTRGLVSEPEMLPVPGDLLEPDTNGGSTLLYYTGITRLAKNILENVVGQCLDRDRAALEVLERIRSLPPRVAQYLAQCRWAEFGRSLGAGWELKKEINPAATNAQLEAIFARVAPFVHGAKIMGAGGGGFMLLVCKSREDAVSLREMLASGPPNPRARFFKLSLNNQGIEVSVCQTV